MFEVKDGPRTLQFSGKLLGRSTSWRRGSTRWIEFELYRTDSGSYILSRIGVSLVYHTSSCPLVSRYGLQEQVSFDTDPSGVPCEDCKPTAELPVIFPEKVRYWAQVSENAGSVLDALYQYDDEAQTRYLTRVAQRLLENAGKVDPNIESAYRVEYIP